MGSWKIMAICSARSRFSCFSGRFRISLPLNNAEPPMRPLLASSPINAKAVWDLPEPDSPTIPKVSPARSEKLRSLTAVTSPSCVPKNKVTTRNVAGNSNSHGETSMEFAPSLSSAPQLLSGSCVPSPRKLRKDSNRIILGTSSEALNVCPRTIRAMSSQDTMPIAAKISRILRPKKVTSRITKNINGKELRISRIRIITESVFPPR
nr:Uncharacterised protein [Ipomoea batatas]